MMPASPFKVYVGWDADQIRASRVAEDSLHVRATTRHAVRPLVLAQLVRSALYTRPTVYPTIEHPSYWDEISQAPMSTGHAISRFLVPALCQNKGWALFTDGDVLFRRDVAELFALADESKAVQVVQHDYQPPEHEKMEGQTQTRYFRKNWSSVCLWHCEHPANKALTIELVNSVPGRDLHRFCWLDDDLIGALPPEWNWLVGHSSADIDPALVHFSEGVPDMNGYEHCPYSDEWYAQAKASNYKLKRPPKPAQAVA
ncbi:MAG: hypothetical protein ABI665_03885 [Vicinamibacterales bacterium]